MNDFEQEEMPTTPTIIHRLAIEQDALRLSKKALIRERDQYLADLKVTRRERDTALNKLEEMTENFETWLLSRPGEFAEGFNKAIEDVLEYLKGDE
jgi:hypothetical protein